MDPAPSLLEELKRRRVVRALIAYGIASFAILQIIEPIMHGLHWPDAVLTYVVVALAFGFPLVVGLAWVFDVNAGRIERAPAASNWRGARLWLLIAGIGLFAAAPGLAWYLLRAKRAEPERAAAGGPPSIAVLPLVNLSSDREQEYFSDGLSEELLNLLAKVPGLRVAARTSAFAFKGKNEDIGAIAEKLHVATILEGSVRKSGDQIRVTAQLINAADGYHLWSDTYDRKVTGVFALQDEIAGAVVAALKLQLFRNPSSQERRTGSPEAYNQYLLGRQFFVRNNVDGFRRAQAAFEKAVALDPSYAPAWAGLALARFWVADVAESATAIAAGQDLALAAAEKAIALGPDLPDGYRARGFVRVPIQWDWEGSGKDFERALELRPDDPDTLAQYAGTVLRALGRLPEARADVSRATVLDPLNPQAWTGLANVLLLLGETGPARDAYNRSLEISPEQSFTAFGLALCWLVDHRPAEALAAARRSSNEVFRLTGAAVALHDLGRKDEFEATLGQLIKGWGHAGAYQIAQVYAWTGDRDRAIEWLGKAVDQRDGGLVLFKTDPLLASVRGDPRYAALARRMHLPAD